jgi:hypothetical protein
VRLDQTRRALQFNPRTSAKIPSFHICKTPAEIFPDEKDRQKERQTDRQTDRGEGSSRLPESPSLSLFSVFSLRLELDRTELKAKKKNRKSETNQLFFSVGSKNLRSPAAAELDRPGRKSKKIQSLSSPSSSFFFFSLL